MGSYRTGRTRDPAPDMEKVGLSPTSCRNLWDPQERKEDRTDDPSPCLVGQNVGRCQAMGEAMPDLHPVSAAPYEARNRAGQTNSLTSMAGNHGRLRRHIAACRRARLHLLLDVLMLPSSWCVVGAPQGFDGSGGEARARALYLPFRGAP